MHISPFGPMVSPPAPSSVDSPRVAKVKIKKTPHEQEWCVMAYDEKGKRMPDADCFETSRQAAKDTAKAMLAGQ